MLAYEDPGKALREQRKALKQALRNARSDAGLATLQRRLLTSLGDQQQEVLRRADFTLPCRPGCSLCCHLRVTAFAHELVLLAQAIADLPDPAERRAVETRLGANAARIASLSEDEHSLTNIPCALLVEEHCSLHAIRPLACARYHSTDLAACQRAHDAPAEHGDRRPVIPEVDLQGDVTIQAMADALKQARLDHRRYELNTTLVRLLDDPGLVTRWRQGRPLLPVGAGQGETATA